MAVWLVLAKLEAKHPKLKNKKRKSAGLVVPSVACSTTDVLLTWLLGLVARKGPMLAHKMTLNISCVYN